MRFDLGFAHHWSIHLTTVICTALLTEGATHRSNVVVVRSSEYHALNKDVLHLRLNNAVN